MRWHTGYVQIASNLTLILTETPRRLKISPLLTGAAESDMRKEPRQLLRRFLKELWIWADVNI